MFLAKFQLVLEKLDLFKSHPCILTSGLLPVPVSLEPCRCCAAMCAVPVGNREAWALCRHQISKSHSLQCRTFSYWSLWHYGEGWIMDLCCLQPQVRISALFPYSLLARPSTTERREKENPHCLYLPSPPPVAGGLLRHPSVPLLWKLLVMWFVHKLPSEQASH